VTRIYTRTGDDGNTDLPGAKRVGKNHPRIWVCGALDELGCVLGLAASTCKFDELKEIIVYLQELLLEAGAELAGSHGKRPGEHPIRITAADVEKIEQTIDAVSAPLEPVAHFIVPGGTQLAARLHLARTVCRRAERHLVELAARESVEPALSALVNRFSDLLFVMARRANQSAGVPERKWTP